MKQAGKVWDDDAESCLSVLTVCQSFFWGALQTLFIPQLLYEISIYTPISQIRKLRPRDVKVLTQYHHQ